MFPNVIRKGQAERCMTSKDVALSSFISWMSKESSNEIISFIHLMTSSGPDGEFICGTAQIEGGMPRV